MIPSCSEWRKKTGCGTGQQVHSGGVGAVHSIYNRWLVLNFGFPLRASESPRLFIFFFFFRPTEAA